MITNFKLFENLNKYNVDDMLIVTNPGLNLKNRLVVIDSIHKDKNGTKFTVWNATKNMKDEEFTISESDIVKKLPSYKEGEYIMLKDYYTGKPKPMIMSLHMELGLFEMIDLEARERGKDWWVEEPYYNIIRKMNKKDLEKYKDLIERYKISQESEKYNL